MALFLDIGPEDVIRIGESMFITLEHKSGRRARLKILGKEDVRLFPKDLSDKPGEPPKVQGDGRRT